jgi:hypothetical protein
MKAFKVGAKASKLSKEADKRRLAQVKLDFDEKLEKANIFWFKIDGIEKASNFPKLQPLLLSATLEN